MKYIEVEVYKLPPRETRILRNGLTKRVKNKLWAMGAMEICQRFANHPIDRQDALEQMMGFEIHHIVPISFGGSNIPEENLALVHPKLHKRIHRFIEFQGEFDFDSKSIVRIPVFTGLVWGLRSYNNH
ncbi:MAG: HNH endonuclease signature motif containing protein [Steroidobacteraceae bacterium]